LYHGTVGLPAMPLLSWPVTRLIRLTVPLLRSTRPVTLPPARSPPVAAVLLPTLRLAVVAERDAFPGGLRLMSCDSSPALSP